MCKRLCNFSGANSRLSRVTGGWQPSLERGCDGLASPVPLRDRASYAAGHASISGDRLIKGWRPSLSACSSAGSIPRRYLAHALSTTPALPCRVWSWDQPEVREQILCLRRALRSDGVARLTAPDQRRDAIPRRADRGRGQGYFFSMWWFTWPAPSWVSTTFWPLASRSLRQTGISPMTV